MSKETQIKKVKKIFEHVSIETFIKYFYQFQSNKGTRSNSNILEAFKVNNESWGKKSSATRASKGKSIFEQELVITAVHYITEFANENKLSEETLKKANEIKAKLYKSYHSDNDEIKKYNISLEKETEEPIKSSVLQKEFVLPIELIPNNIEVFLETLLKTKKATITTFYKNGKQEDKTWNASRMNAESSVIHNLRSRPEFRNPNWQKANIIKVVVEVNNNLIAKPISKKNIKINLIKANTMTKNSAIQLVNKMLNLNLSSNNTNWSNINSSGIWSMEPDCVRKTKKLYLLLNNNHSKKIHAFEIPANHGVYDKLYLRDKKGVYRLVFNVSDTEFIETLKHVNFINFYKGFIDYI
jgi:hypothetical protein